MATLYGPGFARDWFRTQEREAARLALLADGDYLLWQHDFGADGTNGMSVASANTGAVAGGLGYAQFTTGATGSSNYQAFASNLSGRAIIPTSATAKWAIVADLKFTTTPDAQAILEVGCNTIAFGCRGSISTSKFTVLASGGTNITSSLDLDTALHRHMLVRDGTTTTYYIDGASVGSHASAYPSSVGTPLVQVFNQSTAAAQTMQVGPMLVLHPRVTS